MLKSIFKNKVSLIVAIICLILIVAYYFGASRYSTRYFRAVLNPIVKSANFTSSSLADFLLIYFNKQNLSEINQQLQKEIIDLSIKNVELETLRRENEYLKKELAFIDNDNYTHLIARIIGRGPDYISTDLIINKGSLAGVKPGLAVTTQQGVIVGKIDRVDNNIAHVRLLNNNQSKISAMVAAKSNALGLVSGEHNLNLKIELLPKDIELAEHDIVSTSGLDDYIPAGLLIGFIYQIDSSQEKLWQQALIEPALEYNRIHLVDILIPNN